MFKINKKIRSVIILMLSIQPVVILAGAQSISESVDMINDGKTRNHVFEKKGRELTGFLQKSTIPIGTEYNSNVAEDGSLYLSPPFKNQPKIHADLMAKIAARGNDDNAEMMRLIVYLNYHPHQRIFRQVIQSFEPEIKILEYKRHSLLNESRIKPDSDAMIDSLNYPNMLVKDQGYQTDLRAVNELNESLSLSIKNEAIAEITTAIKSFQSPIEEQIKQLSGQIEFSTIAGNLIVVQAPMYQVKEIAEIEGVLQVAEDVLMDSHLNVLPQASMIDPADTSLIGLWDNGFDGGIYDPAIIDSGLDPSHPAMANSVTPLRDNFSTWYLVAADGSSSFDDGFTADDLQGHGTAVAGIVGSYGSSGFTSHLGTALGVEKLVNLKAGFRNTSGRASMFYSDMYNVVDRGLNNTGALSGGDFNDDIDGFNLSYGGETTLDDTNVARFLDGVVATYADTPITVSAGNSGPSNANFSDAAGAYNVISVGNANDLNTISRNDDIMRPSSTLGPTANNRKKPDITTYGTSLVAPNNDWETESDFIGFTGTSASAPVVLGVIMDLNDAGIFDELSVKALLINTAQKNLPGIFIEDDSDGWDEQVGWGVLNAYAAYFHRFDVFKDSVTPRDTEGDFRLYKGTMRDEGSAGEGRDRATLVWNRSVSFNGTSSPSEFFSLADINMRLYGESNNVLLDNDLDSNDNVHQVRIAAGVVETDVVVNVYAWSTSFDDGSPTQEFALATEDQFERVEFPRAFQAIALWPTEVEPNEEFDIEFWLRNDSDIASHNNTFNLELPAGFSLVSGIDTQNVGSAAAGGITSMVTYTVQAPAVVEDGVTITVKHSHNSYNESYGDFNWNMGLDVRVDSTPPNPNPMTFAVLPVNTNPLTLDMTASIATDIHDPIEYYHDYTSSPSGGTGGSDSGWVDERAYTDAGLGNNHEYCYRVWSRDNANFRNNSTPSEIVCTYTDQQVPGNLQTVSVSNTSITISAISLPPNILLDESGIRYLNNTAGSASAWSQNSSSWDSNGLTPATTYEFAAIARNGNGDETSQSNTLNISTLANQPAVNSIDIISDSQIQINLNANGNGSEAEYFIQNATSGQDSGWVNQLSWQENGLACNVPYTYQAKARNLDGIETIIVSIGIVNNSCSNDVIFIDSFDN